MKVGIVLGIIFFHCFLNAEDFSKSNTSFRWMISYVDDLRTPSTKMIDSQSAVEKYFKDGFSSKSNEIKCNFKYTKKILDIRDRIQIIEMVVPVCNYKDLIVEGSSVSCSKSTGKSGTIENDLERTMLAFEKEKKVFTIEIYCGKKL